MDDPCALGWCEEGCRVGEVVEHEIGEDSDHDGSYAFEDEATGRSVKSGERNRKCRRYIHPSPAFQATYTIHLRYCKRQKPRESTRNRRGAEEKCLSELGFVSAVPHGNVVRDSREETSFCDAEEDASDEEAMVVLDDTHERHYDAPCDHDRWQPDGGTEFLEPVQFSSASGSIYTRIDRNSHQVTRHLEGAIREEEDCETPVVFRSSEVQCLR